MNHLIVRADARELPIADGSVQCCITSPPYWRKREYCTGQIGDESHVVTYIMNIRDACFQVYRALRSDGVFWLNVGDVFEDKSLLGLPWRVIQAIRVDGWIVRSEIIWSKPNCQPEPVQDRPTRSHEHVFMLTKDRDYYYDNQAVLEPMQSTEKGYLQRGAWNRKNQKKVGASAIGPTSFSTFPKGKNRRSVWSIASARKGDGHPAPFPPKLVERCMRASSKPGDLVMDLFAGGGTVAMVAEALGRDSISVDLAYQDMARARLHDVQKELLCVRA